MNAPLLALTLLLSVSSQAPVAGPDGWADWGTIAFEDLEHFVQHSVNGQRHRFTLMRVAERTGSRVTRWETLDVVEALLADDEFLCADPARAPDGPDEYLVVGRETDDHDHPVTRAWRFDRKTRRLQPVSRRDLACAVEECLHDEDR